MKLSKMIALMKEDVQKQIDKKFKNVHVKINEIKNTADEALKTAKHNEDQLQ